MSRIEKKVLKIQHQTLKLKCKEKRFAVSKAGIHRRLNTTTKSTHIQIIIMGYSDAGIVYSRHVTAIGSTWNIRSIKYGIYFRSVAQLGAIFAFSLSLSLPALGWCGLIWCTIHVEDVENWTCFISIQLLRYWINHQVGCKFTTYRSTTSANQAITTTQNLNVL